eukprot:8177833-Lingulodinium_polyedra.AAC.1
MLTQAPTATMKRARLSAESAGALRSYGKHFRFQEQGHWLQSHCTLTCNTQPPVGVSTAGRTGDQAFS